MANLSQIKRGEMIEFLEELMRTHTDDASIRALSEIENYICEKKFGLVWEKHIENVDVQIKENIPIFIECEDKKIINSDDKDFNFVLEGDNLQSLYLLQKTHKHKIDVIYIDPPYNTENDDFIYDDVYVDKTDAFRHSKWLSFMSERLSMASGLLSEDGIVVISIGYQEVHNLMVMCQEIFYDKQVTCVTVQTSGGKPNGGFTFVQEYLVFITPQDFRPNNMSFTGGVNRSPFEGLTLSTFNKINRANQVYPIFIDTDTKHIVGVGKSLAERISDGTYNGEKEDFIYDYEETMDGCATIWPISSKGGECVWRFISSRLLHDWEQGYIKVIKNRSRTNPNEYSLQYLPEGVIQKVESGDLEVLGREEGMPTLILGDNQTVGNDIPTIWTEKEFFTNKGSSHIKEIFGEKRFQYPKPLELIMEILRATTEPESIILDFFAGSGTTGEAVLELNAANNGSRKFILCTDNQNDICEHVTYPRLKTVITGLRENGERYSDGVKGNLKYFKCAWTPRRPENYLLSNCLCLHIKEMIELQKGIEIDNVHNILVLNKIDFKNYVENNTETIEGIWVNQNIVFNAEEMSRLEALGFKYIPREFFGQELKEVAE